MEHCHYQLYERSGDVVEVVLDHAANVLLLDAPNYASYVGDTPFHYYGGYAEVSPYRIRPPRPGTLAHRR